MSQWHGETHNVRSRDHMKDILVPKFAYSLFPDVKLRVLYGHCADRHTYVVCIAFRQKDIRCNRLGERRNAFFGLPCPHQCPGFKDRNATHAQLTIIVPGI